MNKQKNEEQKKCPITLKNFREINYFAVDNLGIWYESNAIKRWIDKSATNPRTREPLSRDRLVFISRKNIDEFEGKTFDSKLFNFCKRVKSKQNRKFKSALEYIKDNFKQRKLNSIHKIFKLLKKDSLLKDYKEIFYYCLKSKYFDLIGENLNIKKLIFSFISTKKQFNLLDIVLLKTIQRKQVNNNFLKNMNKIPFNFLCNSRIWKGESNEPLNITGNIFKSNYFFNNIFDKVVFINCEFSRTGWVKNKASIVFFKNCSFIGEETFFKDCKFEKVIFINCKIEELEKWKAINSSNPKFYSILNDRGLCTDEIVCT